MAVYKIFPDKDSTIYSSHPQMNTGNDSILEVKNVNFNFTPQVARSIIQFNQKTINGVLSDLVQDNNYHINLKCFIAKAQGVNFDTKLNVFPISGSWDDGNGMYLDSPLTTNGVSWGVKTITPYQEWATSSFSSYVTSSFSPISPGGGNWYTGPLNTNLELEGTQNFNQNSTKDLNIQVTDIVNTWFSSSQEINQTPQIENNGFIIKLNDDVEFNSNKDIQPTFKFYSSNTHTIYPPQLEIKWDDSVFETGSLPPLDTPISFIGLANNPSLFTPESIHRFRINTRPKYPERTFKTSSLYTENHYIPSSSLYAIKDLDTNEFVINFDSQFTKISCDQNGNYFDIYMEGLEPERYYKILIKTNIDNTTQVHDNKYYFKVING